MYEVPGMAAVGSVSITLQLITLVLVMQVTKALVRAVMSAGRACEVVTAGTELSEEALLSEGRASASEM